MSDYPDEWVEAAGRAVCRDGWNVPSERAAHIGSMRATLAAVVPLVRAATLREAADRLARRDPITSRPFDAVGDLRRWADEVTPTSCNRFPSPGMSHLATTGEGGSPTTLRSVAAGGAEKNGGGPSSPPGRAPAAKPKGHNMTALYLCGPAQQKRRK